MSKIYLLDTGRVRERYSQAVGKYYLAEDIQKCQCVPGINEIEDEAQLIIDSYVDEKGGYDPDELYAHFLQDTKEEFEKAENVRTETLIDSVKRHNDIWNEVRRRQIMMGYPNPVPENGYLKITGALVAAFQGIKTQKEENKE